MATQSLDIEDRSQLVDYLRIHGYLTQQSATHLGEVSEGDSGGSVLKVTLTFQLSLSP